MARIARSGSVGGHDPMPLAEPDNSDPEPDPEAVAHTICLRLLTVRARSRSELAAALTARNVPDDAATRVLDRLTRVGLVDDRAFAADFVSSRRAERGLAGREISRQLRNKGVEDEVIGEALASVDTEAEYRSATELASRKLRSMSRLAPQVQTRRLAGMLARKGYSSDVTFRVVREVIGAAADALTDPDGGLG